LFLLFASFLVQLKEGAVGVGEIAIDDKWKKAALSVSLWDTVAGVYEKKQSWNMWQQRASLKKNIAIIPVPCGRLKVVAK